MQDYGETTHALKCNEKIGLNLGLRKCEKAKAFLTFTVFSFVKLLGKSNCVISYKSHKNCYFCEKKKLTEIVQRWHGNLCPLPKVKSSRTSSRTHFEVLGVELEGQVLGLGLEASSPQKLPCPRLEDSTIF